MVGFQFTTIKRAVQSVIELFNIYYSPKKEKNTGSDVHDYR